MANIQVDDIWEDLGTFERKKTIKVMGKNLVDVEFSHGKLTLLEEELKRIMKGK